MPEHPDTEHATTVAVTQEELEVSRRSRDTGRTLRVRKEVEHEPVQLRVESITDVVDVERVPIDRVVDEPPRVREEGDVTVIPVVAERAVVVKQLVLVEEIRLTRRREVTAQAVQTTLREEHVEVERFDPPSREWIPED